MNIVQFCNIHNCEKSYSSAHQKYDCRKCKSEYAKKWRQKNPVRTRELQDIAKERRRKILVEDKINNPDKYIPAYKAKEKCEKHNILRTINNDGEWACKKCKQEYAVIYRANDPRYLINCETRKAKKFGLTLDEYRSMIQVSNNNCYICKQSETRLFGGEISALAIDHCHTTKKVRGLLCHQCNTALGGFKDNIETLQSAIEYLKKHSTQ